jgi:predicted AAA+ superfamily ATPase
MVPPPEIQRVIDRERVDAALKRSPVVLLTGPRQAGKTTLARSWVPVGDRNYFDLENPLDLARLADPMLALSSLTGLVVIDEAQRVAELFPVLRVLADRPDQPATFLVLGSASPDLVGLSAESLAGRVEILELAGLRASDVATNELDRLWTRGALPPAFTASDEQTSVVWRESYIRTFLERDLGQLGVRVPATTMRRFWTMVAHYHGQTWNGAALAGALDVSQPTIRRYVDHLTDALVLRQLQPWFANTAKRQVKSPKVYVRDSGLLHQLLGIADEAALLRHPTVGASWEGFVIEQLAHLLDPTPMWFWSTHQGAEIDVVAQIDGAFVGFEVKRTTQPKLTPSITSGIRTLQLDHIFVVHAGEHTFALADNVTALTVRDLLWGDEWRTSASM